MKFFPFAAVIGIHAFFLAAVPAIILHRLPDMGAGLEAAVFRWAGAGLAAGGLFLYVRTLGGLTIPGKGTPAVWDPPKLLVNQGLYRHVRNPMYAAVVWIAASEAVFFDRFWLAVYAAVLWAGFDLFVRLYEEPTLRRIFGAAYEDYCRSVPRWIPALRRAGQKTFRS